RVILAPIFGMWFGLGIWSKVALAVTLVFFIVFFNVYQGVREVSTTLLDNARMLGANRKQLLRHVYIPSATSWVFSSLHTSVGLGIWSKVALAVTLVFFIVFFNVYQGVREVSTTLLDNARMLGANRKQLLRHVYIPSATSWVFSSLHTSVGLAFVGAVVGEYLGSAAGVGYLILQAEGTLDVNTVFAGIIVLTVFALILDLMVSVIENRLLAWRPKAGETAKM